MITDYAENLYLYKELNEYADMMLNFIKRQQEEALYALGKMEAREAVLVYNEKTRVQVEEVIEYFI